MLGQLAELAWPHMENSRSTADVEEIREGQMGAGFVSYGTEFHFIL